MPRRGGYDHVDDVDLMRAIVSRESRAMAVLYDRHAPGVLATCLRVLNDRADAEDVLEVVFCELWQHADRFDPARGSPRAYLQVLARSRSLDLLRVRSREQRRHLHAVQAADVGEPAAPGPLTGVLQQERSRKLCQAIAGLDEKQRRVIEMAFFAEMSQSQIARTLDLPLGTVKGRLRAGLTVLRRLLRAHDLVMGGDS